MTGSNCHQLGRQRNYSGTVAIKARKEANIYLCKLGIL